MNCVLFQITWLKDGQRVERGSDAKCEILHVPVVQREDQGMYQCVVSAEGETAHAVAELRLGGKLVSLEVRISKQASANSVR